MDNWRPRRSLLYLPASNLRAIEKAAALPCDGIILDLEDSVGPEEKDIARQQMVAAVRNRAFGNREVIVRVNHPDSPWGADDLAAVLSSRPDAVLIPKVSEAADIYRCADALASAERAIDIWAMIETAKSALRLDEIASASSNSRLGAFVLGTNDFAKETGARLGTWRTPIAWFLGFAVAAAKGYNLAILDGVFNDLDDLDGFKAQCLQAVEFGFDGKTLIHPRQIAICNETFSPSASQIDWAKAVCAAFELPENRDKGVIRLNGKMVERLHLTQAQRLLTMQHRMDGRM